LLAKIALSYLITPCFYRNTIIKCSTEKLWHEWLLEADEPVLDFCTVNSYKSAMEGVL
jgi:hypothetical protein